MDCATEQEQRLSSQKGGRHSAQAAAGAEPAGPAHLLRHEQQRAHPAAFLRRVREEHTA